GTTNTRAELDAYFDAVPEHVLTVVDQAYFEYIEEPEYPDAIEEYFKAGRRVVVLRTFSKIYGLAGLRIGYGVGPASVVTAAGKVRRAFDLSIPAQAAALASLDDPEELARRVRLNAEGRAELEATLRAHGLTPAGPAVVRSGGPCAPPFAGSSSSSTAPRASGYSSWRPSAPGSGRGSRSSR